MRNVFLSFCGADRPVKDAIRDYLVAQNKDYNILHSDEFCGSDFATECIEKIDQAQVFVAIVSQETMTSGSYCKNEIIHAQKRERMGKLNLLLFKLCDCEFTPDYEFLLNGRTDLNRLTRGTAAGYAHLEKKIEYFLKCREEGSPVYEDVYDALPLATLQPISGRDYRITEAEKIENAFQQSNVVFLQGTAGMGKMYTARSYLSSHQNVRAYRADVCGKLRDFILMMDFSAYAGNRIETDRNKRYAQNLQWMAKMSPNVLIVANNVSTEDLNEELVRDLQSIGAKILITTTSRFDEKAFPVVHVGPMEDEALTELFFSRYSCNEEEKAQIGRYLPGLIRAVGGHTGALMFLADTFKTRLYDAQSVIESIENLDFGDGTPGDLAQKAISHFFGVEDLSEMEKNILFYMAWNRSRYVMLDTLRGQFKKLGVRDLSAVNALKVKGYIQPEGSYALSIPETVAIVAREQIVPSALALRATVMMLFEDADYFNADQWMDHITAFAERYALADHEQALDTLHRLFAIVKSRFAQDSVADFLEAYSRLRQLPREPDSFAELTRQLCAEWTMLTSVTADGYFMEQAEQYGVAADFADTDMEDDGEWEPLEQLPAAYQNAVHLAVYQRGYMERMFSILRKQDASEADLWHMKSQIRSLLQIFRQEIDAEDADGDGLEAVNAMNAFCMAIFAMLNVKNYDNIISLYNTYWKRIEPELPGYEAMEEILLYAVFWAYAANENTPECYRCGEKLLSMKCQTLNSDAYRKDVDLVLMKKDIERKDYPAAKRRIERLSEMPNLDAEDELLIYTCYAYVQMFDGDWYALRDFIASILERYREVSSDYMDTLRERYEECLSVIESIEGSVSVMANAREILDASDPDAYRKFLRQQVGGTVLKSCEAVTDAVLAQDLSALSDEALREKCMALSEKMQKARKIDDGMLAAAFGLVREAGWRVLEMKHHRIQLLAAALMVKGYSTQIRNGEGKTFTIVLVAATYAMMGRRVDVISSSEYLSLRDYRWMEGIYRLLGISVGEINNYWVNTVQNQVTYCSKLNLLHKYNADSQKLTLPTEETKQFDCAIVDEADLVLVDERVHAAAYVRDDGSTMLRYRQAVKTIYAMLREEIIDRGDYSVSETDSITVYQSALEKLAPRLCFDMGDAAAVSRYREMLQVAILVLRVWVRDRDYCLRDGRIYCEDTTTGQASPIRGERLNFLILKEKLPISQIEPQKEEIYLSCSGCLFRQYKTLIGTSGTMMASKNVFKKFYAMECVDIPTNKKICRIDRGYSVYTDELYHVRAIVSRVREVHGRRQPVLIVAPDIKRQEQIERSLRQEGIPFRSISYKNDTQAAEVFALAGLPGAVTVSTNLAGRGVDVVLGGDPKYGAVCAMRELGYSQVDIELAQSHHPTEDQRTQMLRGYFGSQFKEQKARSQALREEAIQAGGLYVIGSFLMESLRHEEQICGRAGRQGEPGESEFIVSLQDEKISLFMSDSYQNFLKEMLGDAQMSTQVLTKALRKAQIKLEDSLLTAGKYLNEVKAELCQKVLDQITRLLSDEAYTVGLILEAAKQPDEGAAKQWKAAVRRLPCGKKKTLFGTKTLQPTMAQILPCLGRYVTRSRFDAMLTKQAKGILAQLLKYCDQVYQEESRLAELNKRSYKEKMARVEKRVTEACQQRLDALLPCVCGIAEMPTMPPETE